MRLRGGAVPYLTVPCRIPSEAGDTAARLVEEVLEGATKLDVENGVDDRVELYRYLHDPTRRASLITEPMFYVPFYQQNRSLRLK